MVAQKQAWLFRAVVSQWKDFKDQQDNRTDAEIAGFICDAAQGNTEARSTGASLFKLWKFEGLHYFQRLWILCLFLGEGERLIFGIRFFYQFWDQQFKNYLMKNLSFSFRPWKLFSKKYWQKVNLHVLFLELLIACSGRVWRVLLLFFCEKMVTKTDF